MEKCAPSIPLNANRIQLRGEKKKIIQTPILSCGIESSDSPCRNSIPPFLRGGGGRGGCNTKIKCGWERHPYRDFVTSFSATRGEVACLSVRPSSSAGCLYCLHGPGSIQRRASPALVPDTIYHRTEGNFPGRNLCFADDVQQSL